MILILEAISGFQRHWHGCTISIGDIRAKMWRNMLMYVYWYRNFIWLFSWTYRSILRLTRLSMYVIQNRTVNSQMKFLYQYKLLLHQYHILLVKNLTSRRYRVIGREDGVPRSSLLWIVTQQMIQYSNLHEIWKTKMELLPIYRWNISLKIIYFLNIIGMDVNRSSLGIF